MTEKQLVVNTQNWECKNCRAIPNYWVIDGIELCCPNCQNEVGDVE